MVYIQCNTRKGVILHAMEAIHDSGIKKTRRLSSFFLSTMSSPERTPSSASPQGVLTVLAPPTSSSGHDQPTAKGGAHSRSHAGDVDLSVFDILNIFHRSWFLSRANLLVNTISAQKAEDGKISWVEFTPPFHSHLVKCAVALVPHPVHVVKRVMFVFILELLNGTGHSAFFDLQKGGRKANNAQREKRRLARKRSRAAKRERDREAAKVAKLPARERQCGGCGRKFNSRKTAGRHKCSVTKGASVGEEAAVGLATQATSPARVNTPPATITLHTPSDPSNSTPLLTVTGDLWETQIPPDFRGLKDLWLMHPGGKSSIKLQRGERDNRVPVLLRGGWSFSDWA